MTSPHDALFRWTFGSPEHAAPLLRALLPAPLAAAIAWQELRAVPGSSVDQDQRQQHSDLLFATRLAERPALLYVLLEHKSRPDRWTALQVLGYVHALWRDARRRRPRPRHLPFVVPVVVHYGRRRWTATTDLWSLFDTRGLPADVIAELARRTPSFAIEPCDFARRSESEVRAMALSMTGLWTVACPQFVAAVRDDDDAVLRAIADWADVARQVVAAPTGHDAFVAVQSYVLRVTKLDRRRLAVAIETELGTEAMKKFVSTYDQIKLEGVAQGRAELLQRLLERRFGALPDEVTARIAAADAGRLDAWALRVLDADSLAEVFGDG